MSDRTSIPCDSCVRDRLANDKPDEMSWNEYLTTLASEQEIVIEGNSTNSNSEGIAELKEEIESLRYELDEFKEDMPRKVREELR